ncbi:MAG: galactosyltransferase-related protein [Steroidobacter sp.]
MSVSYLFAPKELRRPQRWLNRWWPSVRLRTDPLQQLRIEGRYAPVSVANWKLIPSVARSLLATRIARPLSFDNRRLTVVIPYRDREHHLQQLMPALTEKLREQRLDYRVLVVEQENGAMFNRGRLLNAGIHYAADFTDYYCLHDVDAVPIVANYACPSQPLRLVNKIVGLQGKSRHNDYYFSGAVSIRKDQVQAANGFSNEYWGWGKEDDDFFFRLLLTELLCYYDLEGTYQDLPNPPHQQVQRRYPWAPPHVRRNRRRRSLLLRGLADPAEDGLNTLRYEVIERSGRAEYGSEFEKIRVRW